MTLSKTTEDREKVWWLSVGFLTPRTPILDYFSSQIASLILSSSTEFELSLKKLHFLLHHAYKGYGKSISTCLILFILFGTKSNPTRNNDKKDRYKSTLLRFDPFPCRLELALQKDRFIWAEPIEMLIDFEPRTSPQAHPISLSSVQS